ncbi:MAG: serine--tRNA ligase [Patescibacteria group bacterium]|nr:serine--tRNA ligase [Patescibacteria group bacterium]
MLDIDFIRNNPDTVRRGLQAKQANPSLVDKTLELDKERRELLQEVEKLRHEINEISNIQEKPSADDIERAKKLKNQLRKLEPKLREVEERFKEVWQQIPNMPAEDVPRGESEEENVEVKKWGKPRDFDFEPKPYWELGESLRIIDKERAAKVSGARFGYLKGAAVLLEFALVDLAIKNLLWEGFLPVIPPVMINDKAMRAMGYLEHGGEQETYHFEKDQLYLIGTSEQAVGPMHMNEVLEEGTLPRRYVAFSTCFRREAGSYGKDTKGIFRVHQFDKVEMFSFTHPEGSEEEHDFLLSVQENLMQELEIPYQVTEMCTGDLGAPAARKYDINAWFPSQDCYRETHSASNCTDFQARRLNVKYQNEKGEKDFVHTLNGTAFAIGRTVLAILENYQQEDGSVLIPEALEPMVEMGVIQPVPSKL